MAEGAQGRSAREIDVAFFRTTFFWPLTLDLPPASNTDFWKDHPLRDFDIGKLVEEQLKAITKDTAVWQRLYDPLAHLGGDEADGLPEDGRRKVRADAYSEYVYFHDFVQHFLFRSQSREASTDRHEPYNLYRRRGIGCVRVVLKRDEYSRPERNVDLRFDLAVERILLYVFRIGVAVLVVEVASRSDGRVVALDGTPEGTPRQITLADVQDFNDCTRRAYAPFFYDGEHLPALVPAAVSWLSTGGAIACPDRTPAATIENLWSAQGGARFVEPFPHWVAILPRDWTRGATGGKDLAWRHVIDERMPILSTISVSPPHDEDWLPFDGRRMDEDYEAIKRGDWIRLCFVDAAGDALLPYDEKFLVGFEKDHCYDRFQDAPIGREDSPLKRSRTRYLVSSYSLVAVGCGWFFDTFARIHMRRHYYQMFLIAHLELAALLSLSSRITRAVADWEQEHAKDRDDAERNLSKRLQNVEHDFLQFLHRFRFTGVSNQLQAAEMFDLLRDRMRLKPIFQDLKDEITTATEFLSTRAAERQAAAAHEQAKAAARQAEAANLLATLAALGLVVGLPMAFFGMNVLTSADIVNSFPWLDPKPPQGASPGLPDARGTWRLLAHHLAVFLGFVAAFTFIAWWLVRGKALQPPKGEDNFGTLGRLLLQISKVLLVVLVILVLGGL